MIVGSWRHLGGEWGEKKNKNLETSLRISQLWRKLELERTGLAPREPWKGARATNVAILCPGLWAGILEDPGDLDHLFPSFPLARYQKTSMKRTRKL